MQVASVTNAALANLGADGFDPGELWTKLQDFGTDYGLSVVGAIIILVVGKIAARMISRGVRGVMERRGTDPSVCSFASSLIYFVVLTVAILAALSKFGIETTSFIAILGAAGFAVGLALQGSLGNFAAGVLLLVLRPFKVGDYIVGQDGAEGTVKEIRLFVTELANLDNIKIIVPNGSLFGNKIEVLTGYEMRRVVCPIGIGYECNIGQARDVAINVMKTQAGTLADPAPDCVVTEWGDSSVNMSAVCWCKPEDYWTVFFGVNRHVKEAFDKNGIEIPFPQRVVHTKKEAA